MAGRLVPGSDVADSAARLIARLHMADLIFRIFLDFAALATLFSSRTSRFTGDPSIRADAFSLGANTLANSECTQSAGAFFSFFEALDISFGITAA